MPTKRIYYVVKKGKTLGRYENRNNAEKVLDANPSAHISTKFRKRK